MKGNMLVKIVNGMIRHLLGIKNRQVRFERERSRAIEESNRILSAYLALLMKDGDEVRIDRRAISDAIGRFSAKVRCDGENYVISLEHEGFGDDGK